MTEKLVTAHEIADKIGLSYGAIQGIIGAFDKYCIKKGGRYYYQYNKNLLKDMKKFYEKKRDSQNKYYLNLVKVVDNLDILIREIKR